MRDALKINIPLLCMMGIGAVLGLSWLAGEQDDRGSVGVAFILAGGVGLYMMLTTRTVARNLHERFNETNSSLQEIVSSQKELVSSQKELVSSQKEIVSSQKEIVFFLKDIASTQKDIASTQKDIASTQKDMSRTLTEISRKLDK